jgi:hypothetical protein
MSYVLTWSECFGCHRVFAYNPVHVPSIRHNGNREPICAKCVARANPERIKNGLEPIVIHPDAYEPIAEELVPWP